MRVADFEQWPLPTEPFDLVVCATAWHWLDPEVRVRKAGRALRPGGTLAVITTEHVRGGTVEFFASAQRCYERWDPATPPDVRLLPADELGFDIGEPAGWECFAPYRAEQDVSYTADEYLDLLLTYSGHRALEPSAREGLLGCLRRLIDERHGSRITKGYLHELITARRPESLPGT